jgi:parvulin-like peptidyl-prolyl isomerase
VKRHVSAVVAAVALGLIGAACSSDNSATTGSTQLGKSDAATVNGGAIRRSDFDADMQDYVHNALFVQSGAVGDSAASGTVSADFSIKTLQADVLFELIRQDVVTRKLTLRPLDDAYVRAQTVARFDASGSPDIFNAFPKRFQDRALSQTANLLALQDALGGGPVSATTVEATYDANPRQFGQICASQIVLETQDDANRVMAELQQGADFAATATKESEDQTTGAAGGRVSNPDGSCPTAAQLDIDFATAALAAPPGTPTGPFQTKLGWHIILVDQVKVLPFEQVESAAAAAAEQGVATKAAGPLTEVLKKGLGGAIEIDPAYGVWDPLNQQILPPGFTPETRPTTPPSSTTVPVTITT